MLHLFLLRYLMGGCSNALSTIDISGAYVGLSSYVPLLVGTFTAVTMYTGTTSSRAGGFVR